MSRNVVTASPDTPLDEIARLLEKHKIKRVPIVDGGKLVGIVSRANLLQGLASLGKKAGPARKSSDSTIRKKVIEALSRESWLPAGQINVTVRDGAVELWGFVETAQQKEAARVAAEITPGVRAVIDNVSVTRIVAGW
jgi:predicted transcriptional regulator